MLDRPQDAPSDQMMIKWASTIFDKIRKMQNVTITKEELQTWVTNTLWKQGLLTVNAIFDLLKSDPADLIVDDAVVAK